MSQHSSHTTGSTHDHGDHLECGHILPMRVYRLVLGALLVLTFITVLFSEKAGVFHFGNGALVVAMLVASAKAILVALFFMHLKYENPLTWLYAAFPIILIGFFLGGIFIDNPFRIDPKTMQPMLYESKTTNAPPAGEAHH